MPSSVEDDFDRWIAEPLPHGDSVERGPYVARRARDSEFDAIYDLVDRTFGISRDRRLDDWLYRSNPRGRARCWIVEEAATGRIVASEANWPWPIARGSHDVPGVQLGDSVVAPELQRRGIAELRRDARMSHPWHRTSVIFGWPNTNTRGAWTKHGRASRLMGPLPRAVAPLRVGAVGDALLRAWRKLALGSSKGVVEEVRRFDSGVDAVARRSLMSDGFWFARDAAFLNWRYFAHPTKSYTALGALGPDGVEGYCILQLSAADPWIMELVAPVDPPETARSLLLHAMRRARDAGCDRLQVLATPSWAQWPLFRRAGFMQRSSNTVLTTAGYAEPDVYQIENWQCAPGDTDFL